MIHVMIVEIVCFHLTQWLQYQMQALNLCGQIKNLLSNNLKDYLNKNFKNKCL